MNMIVIQISILLVIIAFIIFLAVDDKKNQKIREQEDLEELEKIAVQNKNAVEQGKANNKNIN